MADLEVRELRYFRAVATERSMSRAAAALGMAQPPLSRAMGRLERRLGVRLFDRDNRGVTLTPAGETLLVEADRVLDAVSTAAHRTRRAARPPSLVVTAKPGVATALLSTLVAAYRERPAAVPVELLVSGYGEQTGLVLSGRVDLALVGPPLPVPGLDTEPLVSEPRVAAVPDGHPLAARTELSVADLDGHPRPLWAAATPDELDFWTGHDTVPSAVPVTGPTVRDSAQLLEVVALGQGVALVPDSLARANQRPDVAYRPVPDASPYVVAIAWPTGSRSRLLAEFVRVAVQLTGPLAETA